MTDYNHLLEAEDSANGAVIAQRSAWLYKVPAAQRTANPNAYTPFLFSFGLYHVDPDPGNALSLARNNFADGAYLKQKTAEALLTSVHLQRLVSLIRKHRSQILAQYVQKSVDVSNVERLWHFLAVDAITIVAAPCILACEKYELTPLNAPVAHQVVSDAMLLETQIPVFLLELAIQSVLTGKAARALLTAKVSLSLEIIICGYCQTSNPFVDWPVQDLPALEEEAKKAPLLSFLYDEMVSYLTPANCSFQRQKSLSNGVNQPLIDSTPPASRLARCGLKFKVAKTCHICYDSQKCVLFLPKVEVSDGSVRVLHNLLAYEATARFPNQDVLISYVRLMDCLIDTAEDVHILTEAGIICNMLGSHEEVADIWNKMGMFVMISPDNVFSNTISQLDALSKNRWKKWKASLKEKYWEKQPWLLVSVLAASTLLGLSVLQTIFTILAYNLQKAT